MSSESIEKGARWSTHIGKELEESRFGIVVLTKDNLRSPWLHFESGALAKSVDESRLAPLLFGLRPTDVLQPLSQFQVTVFDDEDFRKLLKSVNVAGKDALMPEGRLNILFDKLWPDLKQKIHTILHTQGGRDQPTNRSVEELLEEILILGREQAMAIAHPERLLGSSVDHLIKRILEAHFASEAKLSESEKNTALALMGRWNALSKSLLAYFESNDLPLRADGLRRQVVQFQNYIDEALVTLNRTRSP